MVDGRRHRPRALRMARGSRERNSPYYEALRAQTRPLGFIFLVPFSHPFLTTYPPEPPHLTWGTLDEQPAEGYNPFIDPDNTTPDELVQNFGLWVTSYYEHPNLALREPSDKCMAWSYKRGTPGARPPTVLKLIDPGTGAPMEGYLDAEALERTEMPMYVPMQSALKRQTTKALYAAEKDRVLPNVDIAWLTGTQTNWYCIWGFIQGERKVLDPSVPTRDNKFVWLEGANHLVRSSDISEDSNR